MKRILILYYTQSGQLLSILQSLAKPLIHAGHTLHFEEIKPLEKFPFPWTSFQFFNAFPEVFHQQPQSLKSLSTKATNGYDLIILGYQPWFLTPSRPISSFLQGEEARTIMAEKPVITVLGCRNMWLGAQEKVKKRLKSLDAKLTGHIALIDRSSNLTSLITILRWMFTGNKKPFWFFPAAGVSDQDVEHSQRYGEIINETLEKNEYDNLQKKLNEAGAIDINPNLVLMEKRGQKAFSVWSKFIASGGPVDSGRRKLRVYMFMYLLPTAIFILTPVLWIISKILLALKRKELIKDVEYYKQNSLRNTQ